LYWACLIACLPVGILVGLVTRHALVGLITGCWIVAVMLLASAIRLRTAGMGGWFVIAGYLAPCLGAVILLTALAAARGLG
jgi:hypothetical protein